jgi:serine/threonine protein kinase
MSESSSDESMLNLLRRVSETPAVGSLRKLLRPGQVIASDRFEILEDLGSGGMGRVLSAFDRDRGCPVALKTVGRVTPQAIVQLKREFRTACDLLHPNIIRLHELFRDGQEWFFTMDLIRGVHLPELLRQTPNADRYVVIRTVARQLALALHAVHEFGAVHGDLKPSNFLIETSEPPRVVLLDFGLTRNLGDLSGGGTAQYMAPEQIAGDSVSEVTDWYAFGLVIYEALTGALPARGAEPSLPDQTPLELRELCLRLLERSPVRRPSGSAVLEGLGLAGAHHSSTAPRRARLLGRGPELAAFEAWRAQAPADAPALFFVCGPSGIGKTVFVEHLLETERAHGSLILRSRCRENESIGYKALDGLVDELASLLSEMPEPEVSRLLPVSLPDLLHLFPALRACVPGADRVRDEDRGDQNLIRQRAILAFAELLRNLGTIGRVVLWIDDLQWSDTESALILGPLLGGSDPAPILMLGSFRRDPIAPVPVLDAMYSDRSLFLPKPRELVLGPLDESDAEALAIALLPRETAEPGVQAKAIVRDSAGLPLFITELAQVTGDPSFGWPNDQPVTLHSVVARRLGSLPATARRLLELVALAGSPTSRATLKHAQRVRASELDDAISLLRSSRLIVTNGRRDDNLVDMRHDRLRELVSRSLDDGTRRQHHLSLAAVLEASGGKPEQVATHYQGAGELVRAAWHWLAAAEESAKALVFRKAADFYERALRRAELDPAARNEVRLRRAQMLAYAGEGELAAQVYLATAVESPRDRAIELRRRAAEQLLLSGRIEDGMRVMQEVLLATRIPLGLPGKRAIPSLLLGRARLRLRGLRYQARSEAELSTDELSRLDVAWTMACSMGFVDYIRGADFQNRHLLLALRAGEPRRLGRALALEALNAAAPGRGARQRTDLLLKASSNLVEQTTDRDWSLGLLSLARGVAAYLHCDTEEAVVHCSSAVETLTTRCAGAIWERVTAQRFLIASLFHAGQLARLDSIVRPLLAEAEATANLYARQFFRSGYSIASWLVRDEVDEARRQLALAADEWRSPSYQLPEYNRLISQTYIDLYAGDAERAAATVREHWPAMHEAQLPRIGIVRVQMWQLRGATALAAAADLSRRGNVNAAARLRSDARHCAIKLSRDRSPRAQPMAALLRAACDWGGGREADTRRHLSLAADGFERQGMHLFAASARCQLGALAGAERSTVESAAWQRFRAEGVVRPDKMLRTLAPGFPDLAD